MATLSDPWFVEDQVFLRADEPQHAVRLPSPPTLMRQDGGPPAAQLTLFIYPEPPPGDFPGGGAVLSLALDFGAPAPGIEEREPALPPEVREVDGPIHAPGTVRLYFGGTQLARAPVPAGFRPVVPLAATLDTTQAVLLRETMQRGMSGPLYAVAEGAIVVRLDGPEAAVEIDLGRVKQAMPADRDLPAAEAAEALHDLVADGALRLETTAASLSEPARLLCLAAAAERLFEPAATMQPWVVVPGWSSCPRNAALRLRPDLDDRAVRVRVGRDHETTLPWFAAAPIDLPVGALQQWRLPGWGARGARTTA